MPSEIDGSNVISYAAAPGQPNDVTVERSGTTYTITDMGVTTITDADGPGVGCEVDPIQPNRATCVDLNAKETCWDPFNPDDRVIPRIEIRLSDGNDKVNIGSNVTAETFVFGEEGNDRLIGSTCGSELTGGPGNDYLDGGAGTDVITGNEGNDEIHPGLGDDYDVDSQVDGVTGGPGIDILSYSERTTSIRIDLSGTVRTAGATNGPCQLGGSINDFTEFDTIDVSPNGQVEIVVGGQGDDCIQGSRLANTIKGGAGMDMLSGGLGVDTVDYSDSDSAHPVKVSLGDDPFNVVPGNDGEGNGAEGDNVIDDVENIIGGAGDDTLIGQDRVLPTSGSNPRGGQEGANTLVGGPGNDKLDGKEDADTFDGGEGVDTVTYEGRTDPVVGSIGDGLNDDGGAKDVNDLTSRGDTILADIEEVVGGAGNDVLRGNGGANLLDGRGGNDLVNGGAGNDELLGGTGNDLLEGAGGNDILGGGEGDDDFEGGDGNDDLDGGDGDDLLDGNSGADSIIGGPGFDGADYSERLGPVAASADGVVGDGQAGEGDNIAGDVEDLLGGIDDDTLVGNGGDGILAGGGGDDLLDGGPGADDLIGGAGADRATYAGRTAPVLVDLTTLGGDGEAGENDDIADDVEKVSGGAGNDTLVGDGASNILGGGDGADTINGGGGFDLLHGDGGNDSLNGAGGTDQLFGDAGNDALLGGSEADTLSGGANDDSLDGATGADIINGNDGSDTANYAARTSAVNITLDGAPNDGQPGENDLVKRDVENVSTGSGNDNVNSVDGLTGRVSCGRGIDTVKADTFDTVAADCELRDTGALSRCSVSRGSANMSRRGVVAIRISCPVAGRGLLTLARRVRLGSKRFTISRAGQSRTVRVKLLASSRRYLRNRKRVRATARVAITGRGAQAQTVTNKRRITIRAPKGK